MRPAPTFTTARVTGSALRLRQACLVPFCTTVSPGPSRVRAPSSSSSPYRTPSAPLAAVYELFGALAEQPGKPGSALSGGQQQMLAIGRALMAAPRLVIFDENSLGLALIMVDRLYEALAEINGRGVAMIVIEQNVERCLALADHVAVLEKGRVALTSTPAEMRADERMLALYLGEARSNGRANGTAPSPVPIPEALSGTP